MKKIIFGLVAGVAFSLAFAASASLYDYFGGKLPSLTERGKMYKAIGQDEYKGTFSQNTRLETSLRSMPRLGATFDTSPVTIALFETNLQAPITASATSMTLIKGTDKTGTTFASSTYGFIIDEGGVDEEIVIADCSGATCTNLTRGVSVLNGTTSVYSLIKPHRRGASVKITDAPRLLQVSQMLAGVADLPRLLRYGSSAKGCDNDNDICKKSYIDGVVVAGAPDAGATTKGLVEQATGQEAASSTTSGDTTAPLAITTNVTAGMYVQDKKVLVSCADGKLCSYHLPTSTPVTWTANNEHSANNNFSGRAASTTFAGTVSFGGPLIGSVMASSAPQDITVDFRGGSVVAFRGTGSRCGSGYNATVIFGGTLRIEEDGTTSNDCANSISGDIASGTPVFNLNPVFTATASSSPVAAYVDVCYMVAGTVGDASLGLTSNKYIGFELRNNAGASEVYMINGNGSAQTRTLSATAGANIKNNATYSAVMHSGSRIDFFANGVKMGSHSTNLPTGGFTDNTNIQWYMDAISNTAAGSADCFFGRTSLNFGR